ncbi:zinc finger protein 501-like [Trichoplusia ni]|uniref:Zinc finger protein 501-like n=1 Tax=Trichoplusia ni TaxID=7111 RepID=A0A7E5VUT2_TRINI|nr:zinc finger protein 501-like [Trichoplusia ni]
MTYLKSLCRACLVTKSSFNYFIHENVCPDTYCFCTSVEVSKDEELPRGICNSCYELLKKLSEFKQTCLQSQATLLDLKNGLKYEIDVPILSIEDTDKIENQEDGIKTEDIEKLVKVENEEVDNDYMDEVYHENPELNEEKYLKRKVKKFVKLSQRTKGIAAKVRKKFIYTCDVCQKKFNFKERFEAHKLGHEGKVVTIRCAPCNKTFVTWSGLKRHTESEHTQVNLESLKCATCGKIFKNRQTLKMHEKMHGNRRLIMCDVCGKGFTTAVILRAHLETHKENRERRFTCEHCGKKFFTNTILLSHVSRRHSGRRFICQICSFPFTDKYNLAKHLLIHDGKKLYKCDICNKSFATQSTLTEHKRLHSGERPYVCNYCLKAFVSKKRLTDHVRIHTGDKPHKCTFCEQRFTQRGTLKRHMKVHDRAVPTIN